MIYTEEQRRAIEDIQDSLDDNDDDSHEGLLVLTSELMNICRLVITQDFSATKLYDSPLMHYLAVRGIDEKAEGFRGPMEYSNILAGTLWMVRRLALELPISSKPWPELAIPGKRELSSVTESVKACRLALASMQRGSPKAEAQEVLELKRPPDTEGDYCSLYTNGCEGLLQSGRPRAADVGLQFTSRRYFYHQMYHIKLLYSTIEHQA